MSSVRRFDHVGITVADLKEVTAFFVGLGLEVDGTPMFVEGEFLYTVIGIPGSRTEIVMLRAPDGGTRLELSSFVRPDQRHGSPTVMANELGLRNVAFEVDDLQAVVDRLAADGYGLVGDIGDRPERLIVEARQSIRRRAGDGRLVVLIDDAHLVDDVSAAVLLALADVDEVSTLLTVRRGEPVPDAITALWKDAGLERFDLEPLADPDTDDLAEQLAGAPLDAPSRA